ncbi:MAG: hypothetical protein LBK61_05725 [Spirochaetaceae bacterium]|jgi:hypothetical protein|nr:hypothetical protein [Spirochaetaceae bacterium]
MEKKFFTGMAVLLIASLFFLGCPTDNDDDGPESPAKSAEESLKDDLGGKAAVDGTTVTLTDNVSLAAAVTVPAGVTLSVPQDKTLTLGSGGSLVVTGTLAGAADAGDANVAAKVVVTAANTVTVGANVFYSTAGASVTTVAVGTYIWDAKADGTSAAGWKQLEVVAANTYTLKEYDNASTDTASGVSVASVLKNTTTGLVTIKLTGQFKAEYLYYGDGKIATAAKAGTKWDDKTATDYPVWGDGSGDNFIPPVGKYGAVYVKGFFPAQPTSNVAVQVKPYPGIRFYTGSAKFDKGSALTAPATSDPANYAAAAESDTQRWKKWGTMPADETFAVILYSGAADKTVKLDIDKDFVSVIDKADLLDVVIDYSAVTYAEPAAATPATGYSLALSESVEAGADTGEAGSGVSITSATQNPATGAVTITLGGTFKPAFVYSTDGTTGTAGASWDTTPETWGDGTDCAPPAGKYGAVYIKGLFGNGTTNDAIQIKPYPALNFYTDYDVTQAVSATPLAGPNPHPGPHNYTGGTEGERQRWKLYASHAQNESFGILLNSTATDKFVTLDIDQYDGNTAGSSKTGDILTVIVDYSAVGFPQ